MSHFRLYSMFSIFISWLLLFSFMMLAFYLTSNKGVIVVAVCFTLCMIAIGYTQDKKIKEMENKHNRKNKFLRLL